MVDLAQNLVKFLWRNVEIYMEFSLEGETYPHGKFRGWFLYNLHLRMKDIYVIILLIAPPQIRFLA